MRPSVGRMLFRLNSAHISHSAASVFRGIAVQQFPPKSAAWNPQSVANPRHRSKVTHHNNISRRLPLAQQRNRARQAVATVDPLEASDLVVHFVQLWILPVKPV